MEQYEHIVFGKQIFQDPIFELYINETSQPIVGGGCLFIKDNVISMSLNFCFRTEECKNIKDIDEQIDLMRFSKLCFVIRFKQPILNFKIGEDIQFNINWKKSVEGHVLHSFTCANVERLKDAQIRTHDCSFEDTPNVYNVVRNVLIVI